MSAATVAAGAGTRPLAPAGWRTHALALGLVAAALLALFWPTARAMAGLWWHASTYEHCLAVVPVLAWLSWQRRWALRRIAPRAWAPPLAWVAAGALCWTVGEAAGVSLARQLGLVVMLQGAVATLLGRAAAAALLFPLGYALVLVPAGDALVPPLQLVTARLCIAWLHLAGVPASLDGVFITTPAGWFKVAEACSGAKFLLAMAALGILVAHLGFRGWRRRAGFLALCLAVPVLANGVRAFATIWVAQWRGAEAAAGFDHVIYGWFFFAAVIAAVMAIAWRFFDRAAADPAVDLAAVERQGARQRRTLPLGLAAPAVLLIAGAAPAWIMLAARAGTRPIAAGAHLSAPLGWQEIAATGEPWRPRFDGADRLLAARFRDAGGAEVDLAVALYAAQGHGHELVGYGHGAVDPDGRWSWAEDRAAPPPWRAQHIVAPGPVSRSVLTTYTLAGRVTPSPVRVKLLTLSQRLTGGSARAAAVLVSANDARGGLAAADRFAAALGPVAPLVERVAGGR